MTEYKVRQNRTAKEFLDNARDLNRLIGSTQESIDSLTPPKCGIGAGSHASGNTEPDKQVRRYELEQNLVSYMESLLDYNEALVEILNSGEFTPREKIIIQQRYIIGKSWKEIADYMDRSVDYIRKLDNRLKQKLEGKPKYWKYV